MFCSTSGTTHGHGGLPTRQKTNPGDFPGHCLRSLETLVDCGLAKQVNVEREATRYCPNLSEHGHFICESCGIVSDIPVAKEGTAARLLKVPSGFTVNQSEITLRGICPACKISKPNKI
jgi:Fur family peroxide stress response transcriptional regulator